MSLGMWAQRGSFYFNNSTFLHVCFSWSAFFLLMEICLKRENQEPYLIWCSSCSTTLIYNIHGLESPCLPVWYWKTTVKNKVHKIFPLFKQTNKQKENPPETVSSHWRLPVGLQLGRTVPFPVSLSTRLYFAFKSWTSVRKSFHPTTNYLNLLSPSSTSLFISLDLQTDCVTRLPPLMPAQF